MAGGCTEPLSLVHRDRVTGHWVSSLVLLLYAPVGLCVCALRVFLAFHALVVTTIAPYLGAARSPVLRALYALCGFVVRRDPKSTAAPAGASRLYAANCVSRLDRWAVHALVATAEVNHWGASPAVAYMLDLVNVGWEKGAEVRADKTRRHVTAPLPPPNGAASPPPALFVQPEGMATAGDAGLLRFDAWPFEHDAPVQPVVIRASRPPLFANINLTSAGASCAADVLWSMFVPATVYTVRFLEPMQRGGAEEPDAFAKRVQTVIAATASAAAGKKIAATDVTRQDVLRALPRPAAPPAAAAGASFAANVPDAWVRQVREVMPHVPRDVIVRDLARTRSVDVTLTRLLEGQLAFTPEPVPEESAQPTVAASSTSGGSPPPAVDLTPVPVPKITAKSFANADDRVKTFQARKAAMIAEARRKYLEKHGQYWLNK